MEEEEKGEILEQAHRPPSTCRIKLKLPRIENGGPRCSICGRQFSSMKSLFGHMRCHPERPWRGINPPPTPSVVHLSQSLSGWSVTGKRGRRPASGSVGLSIGGEDQIVHDLLMLAQVTPIGDSGTNKVMETEDAKGLNLSRSKTMRKRRKKKRLRDLEIGENKYMCSMCNRTFKTHQALGGHKSSHNKHTTNKLPSMAHHHHHRHIDSVSGNATKPTSQFMDMEVEHQCKPGISHWSGAGAHQQPSSQVTSAGTGQKILAFDLNYPPPMDQDEEGIDSGFFNPNMNLHILG